MVVYGSGGRGIITTPGHGGGPLLSTHLYVPEWEAAGLSTPCQLTHINVVYYINTVQALISIGYRSKDQ